MLYNYYEFINKPTETFPFYLTKRAFIYTCGERMGLSRFAVACLIQRTEIRYRIVVRFIVFDSNRHYIPPVCADQWERIICPLLNELFIIEITPQANEQFQLIRITKQKEAE